MTTRNGCEVGHNARFVRRTRFAKRLSAGSGSAGPGHAIGGRAAQPSAGSADRASGTRSRPDARMRAFNAASSIFAPRKSWRAWFAVEMGVKGLRGPRVRPPSQGHLHDVLYVSRSIIVVRHTETLAINSRPPRSAVDNVRAGRALPASDQLLDLSSILRDGTYRWVLHSINCRLSAHSGNRQAESPAVLR